VSTTDDQDHGWYPEGFINPAQDPVIEWIVPATDDDPVPPEDRLAEEPVEVTAAGDDDPEDDPNDNLALELRGPDASFPAPESDDADPALPRKFVQPGFGGLDLRDYSRNAQQKGWGAPCSAARATVRLSQAAVTVDARLAELTGLIMRACEARGYIFRAQDTGAYNCRYISGTTVWSNHAWAIAVDVNWQSNPYTTRVGATDIPDWMHNLWNRYGFAWGGDYTGGKRDYMHFEFMGSPQQANQALALARAELGGGGPVPVPVPAPGGSRPIVKAWPLPAGHWFGNVNGPAKQHGGDRRYDSAVLIDVIGWIQRWLIYRGCVQGVPASAWATSRWADGLWEGATDAAMIEFHRRYYGGQRYPAQCWRDDYQRLVA
jgi:hypothetical protein